MINENEILTRYVPVKLTDAEKLHRSNALVSLLAETDTINQEKTAYNAGIKSRLEANANDIAKIRKALATGEELRQVRVFMVADMERQLWRLLREDNEQEADLQPMTPAEYQKELNLKLPLGETTDDEETASVESPTGKYSKEEQDELEQAIAENKELPFDPSIWLSLEDYTPPSDVLLETGLIEPLGSEIHPQQPGYVVADERTAYANADKSRSTERNGKGHMMKSKWPVSHVRPIQENPDADGDA